MGWKLPLNIKDEVMKYSPLNECEHVVDNTLWLKIGWWWVLDWTAIHCANWLFGAIHWLKNVFPDVTMKFLWVHLLWKISSMVRLHTQIIINSSTYGNQFIFDQEV